MINKKYSFEDLRNSDEFELFKKVEFDNMVTFVLDEMDQPSPSVQLFKPALLGLFFYCLLFLTMTIVQGTVSFKWGILSFLIGGFAGLLLIIPIHEAIHGLAYKWAGAPIISFGGSFKKLFFYAAADQFVIGRKHFEVVALSPFLVINAAALIAMLFVHPLVQIGLLGLLLMHSQACIGDFVMLGVFQKQGNQEVYTVDSISEKTAYFYQKK